MAAPGGAASTPPALAAAQIDSVQTSESTGETETEGSTFVNLDTLGLRHSGSKSIITLDNVIHLPEASKNLISISQWIRDNQDNCGVMSRGSHSTFMWDNDRKTKYIPHHPTCNILLMQVNEDKNEYTKYLDKYTGKMLDNLCLLEEVVCIGGESTGAIEVEKNH